MKKADWEGLRELAPNLYSKGRPSPFSERGFEAPDGWYGIVRGLSVRLEGLLESLPDEERAKIRCSQVKEKFGSMCFYMDGPVPDEWREIIHEAEAEAGRTCEDCGAPGSAETVRFYVTTRCPEHMAVVKRQRARVR